MSGRGRLRFNEWVIDEFDAVTSRRGRIVGARDRETPRSTISELQVTASVLFVCWFSAL